MITELDRVVLTHDLAEYNLKAGDIGTVVLVHQEGLGYEVEFMTLTGQTITIRRISVSSDLRVSI